MGSGGRTGGGGGVGGGGAPRFWGNPYPDFGVTLTPILG